MEKFKDISVKKIFNDNYCDIYKIYIQDVQLCTSLVFDINKKIFDVMGSIQILPASKSTT